MCLQKTISIFTEPCVSLTIAVSEQNYLLTKRQGNAGDKINFPGPVHAVISRYDVTKKDKVDVNSQPNQLINKRTAT